MRKLFIILLCLCASPVYAATTTSITRHGITFNFAQSETYGQFVNGDYWVVHPVTITSIAPSGVNNGVMVNPYPLMGWQGFNSDCYYSSTWYCSSMNLEDTSNPKEECPGKETNLSYPWSSDGSAIQSVVKTVDSGADVSAVEKAAVLTVLLSVPPNDGAYTFRPSYIGGRYKTLYTTSDIEWSNLPSRAPVGSNVPSLSTIENRFIYQRIDHGDAMPKVYRPTIAYGGSHGTGYRPKWATQDAEAFLRLALKDSQNDKYDAMIQVLQHCIDLMSWVPYGYELPNAMGHEPTLRMNVAFGAAMLGETSILSGLAADTNWHEQKFLTVSQDGENRTLWGENKSSTDYWKYINGEVSFRSTKDPYGLIDGGDPNKDGYQWLVTQNIKAMLTVIKVIPSMQAAYSSSDLSMLENYAGRITDTGWWFLPDPHNRTSDPDPHDGNPQSISFASHHGTLANGGSYSSGFVNDMYEAYAKGAL